VLFTSGSTGTSKAALHDVGVLLEKFRARRHRLVTITFLLLDHIGGINTLLYTLANGGTAVTISRRDPDLVCRLIEQHRVELLPTTPTFLNLLLLSEAHTRHDLSSLRRISYGTEVMPETTLRRLRTVFPSVDLVQTYGLTEVGILRARSKESGSLFVKVGGEGFETRVADGILFIRARSAMLGYLNAPSPFDEEGWFNTQDCVEVDGEYIRIIGRRSDIINVGGEKVYPAEVESVLMRMENVRDATVYAEPNPIAGQIVAARLALDRPEDLFSLKRRVRSFCRDHLAPFKVPARIEVVEGDLAGPRYKKLRPALRPDRLGFSGGAAAPDQRGG
jgi:acyl-coenzyme A synthetase/AMP-(fatty) acid ligase